MVSTRGCLQWESQRLGGVLKACRKASGRLLLASVALPSVVNAQSIVGGLAIKQGPNPSVPLAAVLSLTTDQPTKVFVTAKSGDRTWEFEFPRDQELQRELPIIGLPGGRTYDITVSVEAPGGKRANAAAPLSYRTPPLPKVGLTWPLIKPEIADGAKLEPGYRFVSIRRRPVGRPAWLTRKQQEFARGWGLIAALDQKGEVAWYYISDRRVAGIKPLANGNLLFNTEDQRTIEMDLLGNLKTQWYAEYRPQGPTADAVPIKGIQSLHHEPSPTPWGTFISMAAIGRKIDNYLTSVTDPNAPRAPAIVMGDRIVEFDRQGNVLWDWNAFDYLDPFRVHYHLLQPYWPTRGFKDHLDWSHGNGVDFDIKSDTVVISLKHMDSVFGIDRKTKKIKWILGEPTGWSPELAKKVLRQVGLLRYPYSPHHPSITPEGTLVYYDNGLLQARPFTGKPIVPFSKSFSRAVEVKIDEKAMTATEVWTSDTGQTPDSCTNWAMGDAKSLPETGNMFVVRAFCPPIRADLQDEDEFDASRRFVDDVVYGARIEEYSRTRPARLLSRIRIEDPNEVMQWQVYGGFHKPTFYWTTPTKSTR